MFKLSLIITIFYLFSLPSYGLTASKKAPQSTAPPNYEKAKSQLDSQCKKHLEKVVRQLRPNLASKKIEQQADTVIASYLEVETSSLEIEMTESSLPGSAYVGNMRYLVHEYECRGKTKAEAEKAPCDKVRTKRLREFTRYDKGKWHM